MIAIRKELEPMPVRLEPSFCSVKTSQQLNEMSETFRKYTKAVNLESRVNKPGLPVIVFPTMFRLLEVYPINSYLELKSINERYCNEEGLKAEIGKDYIAISPLEPLKFKTVRIYIEPYSMHERKHLLKI